MRKVSSRDGKMEGRGGLSEALKLVNMGGTLPLVASENVCPVGIISDVSNPASNMILSRYSS